MSWKLTSTIAGAAAFISAMAIISRSLGFLREIIYANVFGLNKDFDIYLVGAVFPVIINTSVLYLSQNYFIPSYYKISLNDFSEKKNFFNRNFIAFIFCGIVLTILLFLFKDYIIGNYLWNSDQQTKEISTKIFELFILTIPFNAGYSILVSYLYAESKFIHPSLSQLFLNIPIIIIVFTLNKLSGIYTIGYGFLLGNIIQFIYLCLIVRKEISFYILSLFKKDAFKIYFKPVFFIIVSIEFINQLPLFIDRYFYNYVPTGGIASLNYASVLFQLPMSIFSAALSTAIFPKLSEYFHQSDFIKLEHYFNLSIRVITLIFIPISFVYFFEGGNIIKLFFQHGKFSVDNTFVTFKVLQMYSYSLIFYAIYSVINKMIFSTGLAKQLLIISIILILLKIFLNFLFVSNFKQYGLALSSTIIYILFCASCLCLIFLKISIINKTTIIKDISILFAISCLSYYITSNLIELIRFGSLAMSGLKIILFIGTYCLNIYFLKIKLS
jgi:putative peptidoglycan lipid II flippase